MMADGDYLERAPEVDDGKSKLVFIGRDLNRPQLRRGFEACQVPA
jgi:G3E family GTPase